MCFVWLRQNVNSCCSETGVQTSVRHNGLDSLTGGSIFKLFQQYKTAFRQASTLLGEFPKGGEAIVSCIIVLDQQLASPCLAIGTGGYGKSQHFST